MTTLLKRHKAEILKLNYKIVSPEARLDAMTVGAELMEAGLDGRTDGFWVWDLNNDVEFYSPKFRKVLEYEGEHDFPSVPRSWQKAIDPEDMEKAIKAFIAHQDNPKNDYYLPVWYTTKTGKRINLLCAGTIVNREKGYEIMLGTHELL